MVNKANAEIEPPVRQYYMYVLACADNTLYTGYTTDIERREREHNAGVGAKYTRPNHRRPCQIIYSQAYLTKNEAMSAEFHFKRLSRQQKEQRLQAAGVSRFYPNQGQVRINLPVKSD